MNVLKERIRSEGRVVGHDVVKVDSFLNHQLDVELLNLIGQEFYRIFGDRGVTRILTCEASGIAIAAVSAQYFRVPVVFAKKSPSRNLDAKTYSAEVYSYTRQTTYRMQVNRKYLLKTDRVLILDDFLANGQSVFGMLDLVRQAEAQLVGVGIVIEKGFQPGGTRLREVGVPLESLVIVKEIRDGEIVLGG